MCEVVYGRMIDVAAPAHRVRSEGYSIGLHFLGALNREVFLERVLRVKTLQCQDTLILMARHHVSMVVVALQNAKRVIFALHVKGQIRYTGK